MAEDKVLIVMDEAFLPAIQTLVEERFRVVFVAGFDPAAAMELDEATRAEVAAMLIFGHPHVTSEHFAPYPNLKCVSNFGVGYEHVDVEAATRVGLPVGNTPGAVAPATADLGMGLLLASARNIVAGDELARRSPTYTDLDMNCGATVGIVGLGAIGTLLAKRAAGFDMKVLYTKRTQLPTEEEAKLGVAFVGSLEALLPESDFVILALPCTPATTHIMNSTTLGLMKPTAHLINIGRGGLCDQDALRAALDAGTIAGAALDVTTPEPLPRGHPLLSAPNLIITPHMGSATLSTRTRMCVMALDNIAAALGGGPLPTGVNDTDIYG